MAIDSCIARGLVLKSSIDNRKSTILLGLFQFRERLAHLFHCIDLLIRLNFQ